MSLSVPPKTQYKCKARVYAPKAPVITSLREIPTLDLGRLEGHVEFSFGTVFCRCNWYSKMAFHILHLCLTFIADMYIWHFYLTFISGIYF